MGKGMEEKPQKGAIKNGIDWFSSHFKRIFKLEGRPNTYKNNLEQLYKKY